MTSIELLAAMNQPVRRRLLDLLSVNGPSTVGQLADRTGQRVGSVSHHLKVLASVDLVEAAPELAKDRRESWWRARKVQVSWSLGDFEDAASRVTAESAERVNLEYELARLNEWHETREEYGAEWIDAAYSNQIWMHATPAELADLSKALSDLLVEWKARLEADDRPTSTERQPVFVYLRGFPVQP